MSYRQFKTWMEGKDIFGFEKERLLKLPPPPGQFPIISISASAILDELTRHPLGIKQANRLWSDSVEWGQGPGTLQIFVTPMGNAILRRNMLDLEGHSVWVCKKVFPMSGKTKKDEVSLATNYLEELERIDQQMLEMPKHDYNELQSLSNSLAQKCAVSAPVIFMFRENRKLDDNNYVLVFDISGHGVEAPGAMRVNQFEVALNFDAQSGLIRCWGHEVSSPTKGYRWIPQPSDWDEVFCPTQPRREIEEAIVNSLNTY